MKIRIYGASDDLIEVEGDGITDEFNSYQPGPVMWRGDLRAPTGDVMRVYVLLESCWSVAVGQVNEDRALPAWPVTIAQHPDSGYSTMAEIDAPDGTELVNVWPGGED